ncbi:Protein kinase domain [Trypanosoma vivax]|nr:Protein kinase domain [Trypanosoma vivax]
MGNQLAAVTVVNVSHVSSSLELLAPLGCEHRNYFRSFLCTKPLGADEVLRVSQLQPSSCRLGATALPHRQVDRSGRTEIVLKVFVRAHNSAVERQLVEFCYNYLLDIDEKIRYEWPRKFLRPLFSDGSVNVISEGTDGGSHSVADGSAPLSAPPSPCNVLFYSCMEIHNDRFCMLQRAHVAFSLPERLATRPYWNVGNRLFAVYQLLQALTQLHEILGTVHGNLKAENVLVDTCGWLYVTDLCPFNPALLPANNPGVFDYYYDATETHICSLAPEKFVDKPMQLNVSNLNASAHTPSMDMFSAACVIAYIFTEEPLFRLSEVLEFRQQQTREEKEAMVDRLLQDRALDTSLRRLLFDILCADPDSRPTARQLLELHTPVVFPPYFDFIYHDVFPQLLSRPPEQQVQLIWSALDHILEEAERRCGDGLSPSLVPAAEAKRTSALLLLPIILSASVHLITAECASRVVDVMQKILPQCPVEVQADTVLPYLLHYVRSEACPTVARVLALRVLTTICHAIPFSASEATVFEDLVLPCMEEITSKSDSSSVTFLIEVADRLPSLLLLARTFLEQRQTLTSAYELQNTFGQQQNELLDRGWDAVCTLYKHSHSAVVVAVLRRSVEVVQFLGEERAQDEFIPFLTTAIASDLVVQRELYYYAIMCHLSLQSPPLKTLQFFVEEGLRQHDAVALQRTIEGVVVAIERLPLPVSDASSLVRQVLPHVDHPNRWVSTAACKLMEAVVHRYPPNDTCVMMPRTLLLLLQQKVPLSYPVVLPDALIDELQRAAPVPSNHGRKHQGMQQGEGSSSGGKQPPILHDKGTSSSHRSLLVRQGKCYASSQKINKRAVHGVCAALAVLDITTDGDMVKNVDEKEHNGTLLAVPASGRSCGENASDVWKLKYRPSTRESQRMQARTAVQSDDNSSNAASPSYAAVVSASFTNDRTVRSGGQAGSAAGQRQVSSNLLSGVLWAEKELNPVASPYFTCQAHKGAIYCAAALGGTGTGNIVTAGSRGEVMLWSIKAAGCGNVTPLCTGASTSSVFLFAQSVRSGANSNLFVGGTDGEWRLCDVARNEVVTHRSCDGSALTAACCISSDVMLVSTALGSLFAVDRRTGGDVWRSSSDANGVPTSLGPPSGVSSLFCDSRAYGAAVATLGGGVALFDLRFQLLLEQYRLPGANGKQALSPMENPHAILCLCPDTSCASSEQMTSRPGLLLGTRSGTVHHLDLATGKSHIALQPFCTGKATRALLLQPKHAVVFTAGMRCKFVAGASVPPLAQQLLCARLSPPTRTQSRLREP